MHVERMKITNEFISLYKGSSKEVVDLSKEVADDLVEESSVSVPSRTTLFCRKKRKVQRYKLL